LVKELARLKLSVLNKIVKKDRWGEMRRELLLEGSVSVSNRERKRKKRKDWRHGPLLASSPSFPNHKVSFPKSVLVALVLVSKTLLEKITTDRGVCSFLLPGPDQSAF